jgi:hypothetical protein
MINFEVIQSADPNVLSAFKFFQNQIYLGRTSGDLWINDRDLLPIHLMLEVHEKDLLLHPQKGVEFYLLNGKRATAIRKLKLQDEVTIGKTKIKILSYEQTQQETKKQVLDRKLNDLVEENSKRLAVIENLSKLMK